MIWLKQILAARWFPYVLIGALATVTAAIGYGYMKGYNKAESVYLEQMNAALERQLKRTVEQKNYEIKLALDGAKERHTTTIRVREVPRPSDSCDLPPSCVQWSDNILRAAYPNQFRAD